jgi:hypothetical protein
MIVRTAVKLAIAMARIPGMNGIATKSQHAAVIAIPMMMVVLMMTRM